MPYFKNDKINILFIHIPKTDRLSKTNLKQIIINIDYKFSISQATNQKNAFKK